MIGCQLTRWPSLLRPDSATPQQCISSRYSWYKYFYLLNITFCRRCNSTVDNKPGNGTGQLDSMNNSLNTNASSPAHQHGLPVSKCQKKVTKKILWMTVIFTKSLATGCSYKFNSFLNGKLLDLQNIFIFRHVNFLLAAIFQKMYCKDKFYNFYILTTTDMSF